MKPTALSPDQHATLKRFDCWVMSRWNGTPCFAPFRAVTHLDEHGNLTISRGDYTLDLPNAIHEWRLHDLRNGWLVERPNLEALLLEGLLHAVREEFINTYR